MPSIDAAALIAQAQAHPPVMFLAGVLMAALLIALLNLLRGGGSSKVFLDATKFQPLPLTKVDRISHNTLRLRFDLPEPSMRLGLPIGQHITFLARDAEGKDVYRPYTPVTDDGATRGHVEFVIKVYPQGKMSQVVQGMRVGDTMQMKGPRGRFAYKRNQWREIGEKERERERERGGGGMDFSGGVARHGQKEKNLASDNRPT
jgi:cytochrome-b5 reductase